MSNVMNGRMAWVDRARGILIFLVVLGHVIGGMLHFCNLEASAFLRRVFNLIYMFHMPAFFALSGYIAASRKQKKYHFIPYVQNRMFRILGPYFCFGFISVMVFPVVENFAIEFLSKGDAYYSLMSPVSIKAGLISLLYGAPFPGTDGFRVNSVLWFLPCMFSVSLFGYLLDMVIIRLSIKIRWILRVALIVLFALLSNTLGRLDVVVLPYGIDLSVYYVIFYIYGEVLSDAFTRFNFTVPIHLHITFYVISIAVFILLCMNHPIYDSSSVAWSKQLDAYVRAFSGIILVFWGGMLVKGEWLEYLGRISLGIMLIHKYPVLILSFLVSKFCEFQILGSLSALTMSLLLSLFALFATLIPVIVIMRCAPCVLGIRSNE